MTAVAEMVAATTYRTGFGPCAVSRVDPRTGATWWATTPWDTWDTDESKRYVWAGVAHGSVEWVHSRYYRRPGVTLHVLPDATPRTLPKSLSRIERGECAPFSLPRRGHK